MFRNLKRIVVLLALAATAFAQDAASDQETIRLLATQVKQLQERVQVLESRQNSPTVALPNDLSAIVPRADLAGLRAAELGQLHEVRGIQWRGFGEVNFKVLDQRQPELGTFGFVPGSTGNFYTGDFDLFLTSKINDRTSVLSEIVFGEEPGQSFNVDLERFLLKYEYSDHLKLSFGRYHTAIGYYNTAYHSGKWLQTTVDRPLIMEFATDGGLLPTHAVGVSATGLIPSGNWGLNYVLEYGSSDTARPDINGSGLVDEEKNSNHVNAALFMRPATLPGLQIGGSFYHDKISDSTVGLPLRQGQSIVNAHVIYIAHGIESLNEGFLIRLAAPQNGATFNMPAFYSQFSKQFGHIRPYFRYQYVNASGRNSTFDDVLLRHGPSFGGRYDFNDNVAFKLQLDHTIRKGKPDLNGLQTQLAFTF